MVALLILSLALILSFRAVLQADRVTALAREIRTANTLLDDLLRSAPRAYGISSGAQRGFDWSVVTRRTGAERPIEICHRRVDLISQATGRAYWAVTQEPCPAAEATP